MIKARVYNVCLAGEPKSEPEYLDVYIDIGLPVMPSAGAAIKVTPKGDYLEVAQITIDATKEDQGIGIHIEEPDDDASLWSWAAMKAEGWKAGEP